VDKESEIRRACKCLADYLMMVPDGVPWFLKLYSSTDGRYVVSFEVHKEAKKEYSVSVNEIRTPDGKSIV